MANPNIVNVANINGGTLGFHLTNTTSTVLMTVTAEYILKINNIVCANVDGTNAANVSLSITKANSTPLGITDFNTSGTFYLAWTVNVPADDILVIVEKPFYMMEGDVLKGGASVADDLDLFVSYEVIID